MAGFMQTFRTSYRRTLCAPDAKESVFTLFNTADDPEKAHGSVDTLVDEVVHLVSIESAKLIQTGYDTRQFKWMHVAFIDRRWIAITSSTQTDRFWIKQATGNPWYHFTFISCQPFDVHQLHSDYDFPP
jgi:hypothetical protein